MRKQLETSGHLEVITYELDGNQESVHPDILLVHGSCHAASCWSSFQEYFAQAGYRSISFSLRGHGKSYGREHVLKNRFKDYVTDLEHVVKEQIHGSFILIGHSLGGYIVQSYLYQHDLPSPMGCILLTSLTSAQARTLRQDIRLLLKSFVPYIQAYLTGNGRVFYDTPAKTRAWLFTKATPQDIVDHCFYHLQDEPIKAMTSDILSIPSPETCPLESYRGPLLLVGAQQDATLPSEKVQASASAYGVEAKIFPGGHDIMLDQHWQIVAAQIIQWIKNTVY